MNDESDQIDYDARTMYDEQVVTLESVDALLPGSMLGDHLRLIKPIGEGGMGRVFLARDVSVGRLVAVKTLHEIPRSQEDRDRWMRAFRRGAASTARLEHPNIVRLYQYGVHEDIPYMVLEYLRGEPLDVTLARRGALEPSVVFELMSQLAQALAYAHERGVVHRDLKPANIIRLDDGRLKVLDFGIALLQRAREELARDFELQVEEVTEHLGEVANSAGTPMYMAPEQLRGQEQDGRVDVWAFGVVFFELLSNQLPFDHFLKAADETIEPALERLPPDIPESIVEIIASCLSHDPDERPTDFSTIATACSALPRSSKTRRDTANVGAPPTFNDVFFGRKEALAQLATLARSGARLVTLTGPVGSGKTRLACEWITRNDALVVFVRLGSARSREDALETLREAFALRSNVGLLDQVAAALEGGNVTLVLDDAEHVLETCAEIVDFLREHAESARVLVTSRKPLREPGEVCIEVGPMRLPDAESSPSTLEQNEAIGLYLDHASRVAPEWSADAEDLRNLGELVRELDGLPLAIELAASRARLMSPKIMLDRIRESIEFLKGTRGSSRHGALNDSIAWSWDLLDAPERATLAQLSIFEGSFRLVAAEEIVDLSHLGDDVWFVEVLDSLIDHSLVRVVEQGERFALYGAIRSWATQKLKSPGEDWSPPGSPASWTGALRARFVSHYTSTGDIIKKIWSGELDVSERPPSIFDDGGNLELARHLAIEAGDYSAAASIQIGLIEVSSEKGGIERIVEQIEELLENDHLTNIQQMYLNAGRSVLLRRLGYKARSEELMRDVLDASIDLGTQRVVSRTLGHIAFLRFEEGSYREAYELLEEAIKGDRKHGDLRALMMHTGHMGVVCLALEDDSELALARFEEAEKLATSLGARTDQSIWCGYRGLILATRGYNRDAFASIERSVSELESTGQYRRATEWRIQLVRVLTRLGRFADAREAASKAWRDASTLSDWFHRHLSEGFMGVIAARRGEFSRARDPLLSALRTSEEMGSHVLRANWLAEIGKLQILQGDFERALEPVDASVSILSRSGLKGPLSSSLLLRARIDWYRGRPEDALARSRDALELLEHSDKVGGVADLLIWRAHFGAGTGEFEHARDWWAQARELCPAEELPMRHALALALEGLALARERRATLARARLDACARVLHPLRLTPRSENALYMLQLAEALGVDVPLDFFG